jgi:hypothetical protein
MGHPFLVSSYRRLDLLAFNQQEESHAPGTNSPYELPSKQAIASSHLEYWLLGLCLRVRSGPVLPRLKSRLLPWRS